MSNFSGSLQGSSKDFKPVNANGFAAACDFQQNPLSVPQAGPNQEEVDEAAADMFLNWVYEEISPINLGFENIDWTSTSVPSGCLLAPQPNYSDGRNPGQLRYQFMEDAMSTLAAPRGW